MRVQLTDNFYLDEFTCKDESDISQEVLKNIIELADNMQDIRDTLKASITVNSGYRSPDYNKSIGGAKRSQHLLGIACDFTVKGYTPNEVADLVESLMIGGHIVNGGLGRYNNFTHYDIRANVARWDNR